MQGFAAIGCISDFEPQPLLIRANVGTYAICFTGVINNAEDLIKDVLSFGNGHFDAMTGGKVNIIELWYDFMRSEMFRRNQCSFKLNICGHYYALCIRPRM